MNTRKSVPERGLSVTQWFALRDSFAALLRLRTLLLERPKVCAHAMAIISDWARTALALDDELCELRKRQGSTRLDLSYHAFDAECIEQERAIKLDIERLAPDTSELVLTDHAEPVAWIEPLSAALEAEYGVVDEQLQGAIENARDDFKKKRAYLDLVRQHVDLLHTSEQAIAATLSEAKKGR